MAERPDMNSPTESPTAALLRRLVLAVFLFGVAGAGAELLLLGHYEDLWQWTPLVVLALAPVVLGWRAAGGGRASLRAFQVVAGLFVASGVAGLVLHYRGNMAFELEMYPSLGGLELVWEAIRGATPALAPGTMIQLGLLGALYTFRHPALDRTAAAHLTPTEAP